MNKIITVLIVIPLLLVFSMGTALPIDTTTYNRLRKIIESVNEVIEQNETIIKNQQVILREIKELKEAVQSKQKTRKKD